MVYIKTKFEILKVKIQIFGTEEVCLSKKIPLNSIAGQGYLRDNPNAFIDTQKSEILVTEFDYSYFINHEFTIYPPKTPKNYLKNSLDNYLNTQEPKNQNPEKSKNEETTFLQVPFSVLLPKLLPSSFQYSWIEQNRCLNYSSISYKIVVRLQTDTDYKFFFKFSNLWRLIL